MEAKPTILTSRDILRTDQATLALFQEHFRIECYEDFVADPARPGGEDIQGIQIGPFRGLFGVLRDEKFISMFPNLKIIATPSIGVSHLDMRMFNRRGIQVSNIPGDSIADPTAEFGFGLMLALARNMHKGMKAYLQEDYDWMTYLMVNSGSLLMNSTLGIVGMGRIGYKIAERAAAFKMKIVYYNRTQRSKEDEERIGASYCQTLDELLRMSDHVMLTIPLTDQTKGMIGAREFKLMKSNAAIINIGRGLLIDQDALMEALNDQTIRGAALDVTTPEPLPRDHPLLKMPNVIVTPHTAGATVENFVSNFKICIDNIKAAIEGRPVPNEVILPDP